MFKFILIFGYFVTITYGMDCSFGASNTFEKIMTSCPRLLVDKKDEEYCCPSSDGSVHCCDLGAFVFQWFLMIWPYMLLALLVLSILSCVCCCLRQMRIC